MIPRGSQCSIISVLRCDRKKTDSKVDAYISVNFSYTFTNFVSQELHIFIAFYRDALHYHGFTLTENREIIVKLVEN